MPTKAASAQPIQPAAGGSSLPVASSYAAAAAMQAMTR